MINVNNFAKNKIEFEKKLDNMNLLIQAQGGSGYNIMYREINPIQKKTLLENTIAQSEQG
jgi:hypothetical protein